MTNKATKQKDYTPQLATIIKKQRSMVRISNALGLGIQHRNNKNYFGLIQSMIRKINTKWVCIAIGLIVCLFYEQAYTKAHPLGLLV